MKLIFALSILLTLTMSCQQAKKDPMVIGNNVIRIKPVLNDSINSKFKDGDIIIRKGDGPLSYHLMRNSKENYTHCGIIFNDNDKLRVIHSVGGEISKDEIDGIQTMDLDKFIEHSADSTLYICRPVFMDSAGYKIVERAKEYLALSVPFDHRFNLLDKEKLYCSELLYHIFKDINNGKNLFIIHKKHKSYMLMFSTFFNTNNFEKVFDLKEDYRN
jgi:hypothetical protein